jgi:hypothetical protein
VNYLLTLSPHWLPFRSFSYGLSEASPHRDVRRWRQRSAELADSAGRKAGDQRTTNSLTRTRDSTYNYDGSVTSLTYLSGHALPTHPMSPRKPAPAVDSTGITISYATGAKYTPSALAC